MTKISDVIIGMILLSLIIGGFVFFLYDMNDQYQPSDFNETNSTLWKYQNRSIRIQELTQEIKSNTTGQTDDSEESDILGSLFRQGYSVMLISLESLGLVSDITIDAVGDTPAMGNFKNMLLASLLAIATIIIIFIIISSLVKREL